MHDSFTSQVNHGLSPTDPRTNNGPIIDNTDMSIVISLSLSLPFISPLLVYNKYTSSMIYVLRSTGSRDDETKHGGGGRRSSSSGGRRRRRLLLRRALKVAFLIMLLVGGGLLLGSANRRILTTPFQLITTEGRRYYYYMVTFDSVAVRNSKSNISTTNTSSSTWPSDDPTTTDTPTPSSSSSTTTTTTTTKTTSQSGGRAFTGNMSSVFEVSDENWPRQPKESCRYNLSFYVYDHHLPRNLTGDYEDRIRRTVDDAQAQGERVQENVATEWTLLQLFRTSPCRTYDPHMALFYFVPYMHYTHCTFHEGYAFGCGQVPDSEMDQLFDSLPYYYNNNNNNNNSTTATTRNGNNNRHIFVNVYDSIMSKKVMNNPHHLTLTSGPLDSNMETSSIVVPIFHDDPRYQPSALLSYDETWWVSRPRTYAFVSFYGPLNPRMNKRRQPRRFREYFWKTFNYTSTGTMGDGRPFISLKFDDSSKPPTQHVVDMFVLYRDAVLCPILPGDTTWQRRFFDVIRNGCLPVVLEWPLENGKVSWHVPNGHPVQDSYPFFKGGAVVPGGSSSSNNNKNGAIIVEIDYLSFVVRAPGNPQNESDMTSLIEAMENVLADPQEIARRRRNMMTFAPLLTFGLGKDAHVYDDAFAGIMRILERRVQE